MTVHLFCRPTASLGLVPLGLVLFMAAAVPSANDARAQSIGMESQNTGVLMDRIDRLERDIRTLNQQIARSPAPAAASGQPAVEFTDSEGMMSRVMVRLGALEKEVRDATGQSESLSFRIDQLNQRLDKLLIDLDYRLARLEGGNPGSISAAPSVSAAPSPMGVSKAGAMPPVSRSGGAGEGTMSKDGTYQPPPGEVNVLGQVSQSKLDQVVSRDAAVQDGSTQDGSPPAAAAPAASPPVPSGLATDPQQASAASGAGLPEGRVQDQYKFAFDLTRQARFDEAETAFQAFIQAHGEDDLANNARYWLAETFYVRKRYMEAAQAFFEAYQKAPQGQKAPDSLLKLGMSMAALDKPTEACATFGKLRKEFTPMKDTIEQALNREVKRLACQ